ncbi:GlxA family transcriptional regulator [Ruegeria sp. Ofav3-42]|uniref:GlxA family transcriptional regulator n=1 Tax=Ruegeria sp. Ofav3-42 TaxID=2917759 RepID=UPI001EF6ED79|nr:GlxA family transcriptional regulator [Ruegeria sp. Ofav3-42]MCG7522360.1 GlxA family transcriptional regulator [Ruegeria sp. Ofav3-42]
MNPGDSRKPEMYGFLLCPGHPMLSVSAAIDALALANYVGQKPLYSWCTISAHPGPVKSMNSLSVQADYSLQDAPPLSTIVVCCGVDGHQQATPQVMAQLRRLRASGISIGAVSTGTWVLAHAGLLKGRRCTIHWEDRASFRETFPDLNLTDALFETDGPIFTCSGGTTVVDLTLTFVAATHGIDLANKVAEQLLHDTIRQPSANHWPVHNLHPGIADPYVRQAVELMEGNLELPLPLETLAARIGISLRQLERLFQMNLGRGPKQFYLECRLQLARSLLRQTALPVIEVALACGFSTSSYLAKRYSRQFGRTPLQERRAFSVSAPSSAKELTHDPHREHHS